MRHFVQGVRVDLRVTVLLKQPKSFQGTEEMARLAAAEKTTMNSSNQTMAAQLGNLIKTLTPNAMTAGTSSSVNNQQQAMQAQIELTAYCQHKLNQTKLRHILNRKRRTDHETYSGTH